MYIHAQSGYILLSFQYYTILISCIYHFPVYTILPTFEDYILCTCVKEYKTPLICKSYGSIDIYKNDDLLKKLFFLGIVYMCLYVHTHACA